jgi:hypothetical protein
LRRAVCRGAGGGIGRFALPHLLLRLLKGVEVGEELGRGLQLFALRRRNHPPRDLLLHGTAGIR